MQRLKWDVATVDGVHVFVKRLLFLGDLAKIHRPEELPSHKKLIQFLKTRHIRRLVIEPVASIPQSRFSRWCKHLPSWIRLNRSPFLPTKTIRIDLTKTADEIFKSFSEAKRRAVRRAITLGVVVKESDDSTALIRVKNKSSGMFGFITTTGIRQLWDIFAPKHATILLAHAGGEVAGGVLLLFWDRIAYYWIAGATKQGKKLFAPTLLVWEALQLAKKRGARSFDFVGVWDERIPKQNREWLGFTKFKEGFGGKTQYYPLPRPTLIIRKTCGTRRSHKVDCQSSGNPRIQCRGQRLLFSVFLLPAAPPSWLLKFSPAYQKSKVST